MGSFFLKIIKIIYILKNNSGFLFITKLMAVKTFLLIIFLENEITIDCYLGKK